MTMTRSGGGAFVLMALGILLAGCLPTSENPVVNPSQSVVDERLFGSWFGTLEEDDDTMFLHIFKADVNQDAPYPEGMRVVMVSYSEKQKSDGGWVVMHALSARNDDRGVLSLWFEDDSGEPVDESLEGWHLYGYSFNAENQLVINPIDEDILIEFIEDGRLPGTAKKMRFSNEIRVTASSDALVKLFESAEWPTLLSEDAGRFERQAPAIPSYE